MASSLSNPPAESLVSRIPPGPRGHFLAGDGPEIGRKGLLGFFVDLWHDYGDTVRIHLGPAAHHVISHPEHVKYVLQNSRQMYGKGKGFAPIKLLTGEGLLTTEYERWQPRRRLAQPPFTPKGVQQFAEGITRCTQDFSNRWELLAETGQRIDINQSMKDLTMIIISRIMLKVEVGEQTRGIAQAFTFMIDFVTRRIVSPLQLPMSIPLAEHRRFNAAKHSMDVLD